MGLGEDGGGSLLQISCLERTCSAQRGCLGGHVQTNPSPTLLQKSQLQVPVGCQEVRRKGAHCPGAQGQEWGRCLPFPTR